VDVVVDVGRELVVDHVQHVGDVEAPRRHVSRHEDRRFALPEAQKSRLTLALRSVAVDRSHGETLVVEVVLETVGAALGLYKDQREALDSVEELDHGGVLVLLLDVHELLHDEVGRRADASDPKEDVVVEEVRGEPLDLDGERRAEEQGLPVLGAGHVLLLHDPPDLGLEAHVEHPVCLVEDQPAHAAQRHAAALDQIDQSAGRGDEDLHPALELPHLRVDLRSSVDDRGTQRALVRKLAGLLVDLHGQLPRGCEDERQRLGSAAAAIVRAASPALPVAFPEVVRRELAVHHRDDGKEESGSLAGAGLGAGHQVTLGHDDGDGVLLHGRRTVVTAQLDVLADDGVEVRFGEVLQRLRAVIARSFDGDVVVLVKIDARVRGSEEVLLYERVVLVTGIPTRTAVVAPAGVALRRSTLATATTAIIAAVVVFVTAIEVAGGGAPRRLVVTVPAEISGGRASRRLVVDVVGPASVAGRFGSCSSRCGSSWRRLLVTKMRRNVDPLGSRRCGVTVRSVSCGMGNTVAVAVASLVPKAFVLGTYAIFLSAH
jgi:hypothetical protein